MTTPSPRLVDAVRTRLVREGRPPTPARVAAALRAEGGVLGDEELLSIARTVWADLAGAGPLDAYLRDPEVTDVLVNRPDDVWVDAGSGLRRVAVRFADEPDVRRLAQRLASLGGRRLDDASPYVDARLPDGVRLHAVLPPIAAEGTCLSLRMPRRRVFSLPELVAAGGLPSAGADLLYDLIAARAAFLVTGGTGTGKTTLLSALLSLVPPDERVVLVEDSAELRPRHPHVVRLESRPPNIEGAGAVVLRDLVRQALRMRPDRLVVGEVRGAEVVDLLSALNTGHEGGCGTLHANRAADVPARLEALACAAGLSREAVHSQLAAALDVVVHLTRDRPDGRRRVAEICTLHRSPNGLVTALPAATFTRTGEIQEGPGAPTLHTLLTPPADPIPPHPPSTHPTPGHPTPGHPAPAHPPSAHPAPDHSASERPAPDRSASDRLAPDRLAPDRPGPDRPGAERGLSGRGGSVPASGRPPSGRSPA